jgi:hypothetical protein
MQGRGPYGDRPAHQIDGQLVLPTLMRDQTAEPQRLRMPRIDPQYPTIGRLGGLDSAGLVILHRNYQCLRQFCHVLICGYDPTG